MVTDGAEKDKPTHYQVLELPWDAGAGSDLSAQYLKVAYRRALVQNHPDKSRAITDSEHNLNVHKQREKKAKYTIDQVTEAYATLSVPKLRSEYDRILKLRTQPLGGTGQGDDHIFRSGLEAVDLDDLGYDEMMGVWFKSCRCGDERGFQIREEDLEEASDVGELHVGCRGCSLWLRVLFGVVEDKAKDCTMESGRRDPKLS